MLKSRPSIALPLKPLIAQLQSPDVPPATAALALLYLNKAFARATPEQQAVHVPALLALVDKR